MTYLTERENPAVRDPAPFQFRNLEPSDGMALHRLVRDCPPLDPNSVYCNLLQCSHFSATSIAAVNATGLVGSVTAYLVPGRHDTLFVWQVAVHPSVRGCGLARTLLRKLMQRVSNLDVRYLETSITPDNEASQRLFAGFATEQGAAMVRKVLFDRESHFDGEHETEHLYRIGPIEAIGDEAAKE